MTKKSELPLPPYFNLDPKAAADRLPHPSDTARFAKAAAFAARGREDLAKRGYAPDGRKRLRKFSTWEVCRYLIPVAPAHLRRVLKQNPDLPQGEGIGGSVWGRMRRDHARLFWRSRADNEVNGWYFSQADGSFKSGHWNVFWYGYDTFEEARRCVEVALSLPASLAEAKT